MTRREAREHLFCLLFQKNFYKQSEFDEQITSYFEALEKPLTEKEQKEITDKLENIIIRLDEIDAEIEKNAKGWRVSRIAKAELCLLRIGVYEAKYDEEVPVGVAVNEAVELAKKYGTDNAPSFINGILGKIVNE